MQRALHCAGFGGDLAGLIVKQIDSMACMMPEQMICPASRFSFRIHVRAAVEKRLNHEMLQFEFTGFDLLVDPLVAGIESPCMSSHRQEAGVFLNGMDSFGIGEGDGNWDLDLHVLSRSHAFDGLCGMELRRCSQN